MNKKPVYKTWIRVNKILTFSGISLFLILISLMQTNLFIRISVGVFALPFLYILFIISYSYYQFSDFGGNFQHKIHNLIIDKVNLKGDGRVLDIGAGSASLITKLAKSLPKTSLVGIDYWGEDWEYSKQICEINAECEGVVDRIDFIKASASKLPFDENEFDVVVSCLTFHEVKDESDKIKVLKEAIRVLKKDGEFVFLDLFFDKKIFGKKDEFFKAIDSLGILEIRVEKLKDIIEIPSILLHKKVLGNAVIISGRK
jgi:ubiquinone/menaquinone biosynthesis C-methylase UbiE